MEPKFKYGDKVKRSTRAGVLEVIGVRRGEVGVTLLGGTQYVFEYRLACSCCGVESSAYENSLEAVSEPAPEQETKFKVGQVVDFKDWQTWNQGKIVEVLEAKAGEQQYRIRCWCGCDNDYAVQESYIKERA